MLTGRVGDGGGRGRRRGVRRRYAGDHVRGELLEAGAHQLPRIALLEQLLQRQRRRCGGGAPTLRTS